MDLDAAWSTILWAVVFVSVTTGIFSSIREISAHGPRRKQVLTLVVCLVMSRSIAGSVFFSIGELRMQFDKSGKRVVFQPSQEELKQREEMVRSSALIENQQRHSFRSAVSWLLIVLFAALFGWSEGRRRKVPTGKQS